MKQKIIMAVVAFVLSFFLCCIATNSKENDTYIAEEYQQYCVEIGNMYGICPELLMAMIESESSGNPNAQNGNCKGLMQVSGKWHKDRMKKLGVANICDPYGNILVATDYLMELAEKYEDIGMVLMVYNGNSRAKDYWNGNANLSKYAEKILARSEVLERIHGK